jgi:membrane dipeptidase
MDTVADMPKIADALSYAGFSEKEVDDIMGGNWLRFLRRTLSK